MMMLVLLQLNEGRKDIAAGGFLNEGRKEVKKGSKSEWFKSRLGEKFFQVFLSCA